MRKRCEQGSRSGLSLSLFVGKGVAAGTVNMVLYRWSAISLEDARVKVTKMKLGLGCWRKGDTIYLRSLSANHLTLTSSLLLKYSRIGINEWTGKLKKKESVVLNFFSLEWLNVIRPDFIMKTLILYKQNKISSVKAIYF